MPALIMVALISAAPLDGPAHDDFILARDFAAELTSGDFEAASARLSPELAGKLTAPKLARLWGSPAESWGPFQRLVEVRTEGKFIIVTCVYESGTQKLKITFDAQKKVASLWVTQGTPTQDFDLAGRSVVEELASGAWARVVARFTPEAAKALPAAELAKAWSSATEDVGALLRVGEVKNDRSAAPITMVDVTCEFARAKVVVRVSFDGALRIRGLFFNPH